MPVIHLNYLCHFLVLTGKYNETVEMKGENMSDLISELDEKYPGFKDILIPPEIGIFNIKTMIYLQRYREPPRAIVDLRTRLKDDDTLTIW